MDPDSTKESPKNLASGRSYLAHPPPGEEVVISGISGRFPDSDNMVQLAENLYNKVDMVSDDNRRWKANNPEIPQRTGKINKVSKFDASFFGIDYKQAHTMEPMSRIMLETAFEAIVDAGINPKELRGTNTGVFVGVSFSECEKTWFYDKPMGNGLGITGCSRAMLANRISYWLGVYGPSYSVDAACCSSATCVEIAYRAIRDGVCDAALVGGCNLCLLPNASLQLSRMGTLSPDGKCKTFDNKANGYARSEAVVLLLLQKSKYARRAYATVVHAKTNCDGYKIEGITHPSGRAQQKLLKDFYRECGIESSSVNYVEAHGTGTKVGDPIELRVIDDVFCVNRETPLLIGSVKTNIGHTEQASGLCSIAKVIIGMETGYLIPNINLKEIRKDVEAFASGLLSVVTEKMKWDGGLVGINNFGFGGANCHILLRSNDKEKISDLLPTENVPQLVLVSGRTIEAVEKIISEVKSHPLDTEFKALLHEIFKYDIPGHAYRGYIVQTNKKTVSEGCDFYAGNKTRPIWFVFSGVGSECAGMGAELMKIPIFAAAVESCHKVLYPKGINVVNIITSKGEVFNDIISCVVGICAIQIGLVNILSAIGIIPDKIIGHSWGEIVCAYADGCFTLEQTILAAYSLGLAFKESQVVRSTMATVGVGYLQVITGPHTVNNIDKYKELQKECPPTIYIACHNSFDSCTISGPENDIKNFVAKLRTNGIFAKEIKCSEVAYHSRYIQVVDPVFLKYLNEVIPNPKLRSEKWVSMSVPESQCNEDVSKYSSFEYQANSLSSSVLFEETFKHISTNAIVIEIIPQELLQDSLTKSLHKQVTRVSLTQRNQKDNSQFLFTTLGKLYQAGCNPYIQNLFPKVNYPVSRGTPMISPLIKWEHSEDWYVTRYQTREKLQSGERILLFNPADHDRLFVRGHVVDGQNIFPATYYIQMVWETFAMMQEKFYSELSVTLENIRFVRATTVPTDEVIEFTVMIQKATGVFEVIESGTAIVTGKIFILDDIKREIFESSLAVKQAKSEMVLTEKDIYKELRLRGYGYMGLFRSLVECNNLATTGCIRWHNNWVAFMDNLLQLRVLQEDTRALFMPTSIQTVVFDVRRHGEFVNNLTEKDDTIPAHVSRECDIMRAGGLAVCGLIANPIAKRRPLGEPTLGKYVFMPNKLENRNLEEAVRVFLNLGIENLDVVKPKLVELIDEETVTDSIPLSVIMTKVLNDIPLIQPEMLIISNKPLQMNCEIKVAKKKLSGENNCAFIIGTNFLARTEIFQAALDALKPGGFVISREALETNSLNLDIPNSRILLEYSTKSEKLLLLSKSETSLTTPDVIDISTVKHNSFVWLSKLQQTLKINPNVILFAQSDPLNGILGLVNSIRKEPEGKSVKCFFIADNDAPAFDTKNEFYKKQIDKNLAVNIYKNGKWGTYRYLMVDDSKEVMTEHSYVNVVVQGDLSSLKWLQGSLTSVSTIEPNQTLINVYYSALNFRDIVTATGKVPPEIVVKGRFNQECVLGVEFSGRNKEGHRVMGIAQSKALATMVVTDTNCVWKVPDNWSLEDAATVPVAYATAYIALVMTGKIERGQTVLIHSGSGGVGQAAIHLALHYGCKVFTTVGTLEKREFIRKFYPQITDSQIGNSHSTSFEQLIMAQTDGRGVDLVLNSLAEDKLQASVRCLAPKGKFLEIGKFDMFNNNPLELKAFLKEISFHGVLLDSAFESCTATKKELHRLVEEGIKCGAVKPLTRQVFQREEIESAFRIMASGKHLGKLLISVRDEEKEKLTHSPLKLFPALPRLLCSPNKTYVIIGGLGGFGLELADRLILRGARKLVLTSRKGVSNGYQAYRIRFWRSNGAKVLVSTANIDTEQGVQELLMQASEMAPVDSIYNLALILRDALIDNQTLENFEAVFKPKAVATRILDTVSRKLCPKLKQFITFSSISCGRGNAGQTNYAMANSVMERICEQRREEGLPGLTIQWGAIGDVGVLAETQENHTKIEIEGTQQQRISNCLDTLDVLIAHDEPILSSMVVARNQTLANSEKSLVNTVMQIMGIRDLKTVSPHSSLAEIGMDSMSFLEVKQTLERDFEIFLTTCDIRSLTFAKLLELDARCQNQNEEEATSIYLTTDETSILFKTIGDENTAFDLAIRCETAVEHVNKQVFLIPGIESCGSVFNNLARKLNSQAFCLQIPPNSDCETIQLMAELCLQSMKNLSIQLKDFVLIGYSFGTLIALEMAIQLESEGYMGQVIMIDGSPSMMLDILNKNCLIKNEGICPMRMLELLSSYTKCDFSLLKPIIESELTWEKKLEIFIENCPQDLSYSISYQRAIISALRKRLNLVVNYIPTQRKLISPIKLIRSKNSVDSKMNSEDYSLSDFSSNKLEVCFVEGNHLTILDNVGCVNIINNFIESDHTVF